MANTKIEWTDKVWNPITGCSHSGSPGCDNCYARRMANRLKGRYGYPKDDAFRVTFHPERIDDPKKWKKPCRIFVVSMGDMFCYGKSFHVEEHHLRQAEIFKMMKSNPRHTYLLLTKRPENMAWWAERFIGWWTAVPDNWWLGVSVEDQKTADERIPILLQIPAAKRFVSVEPMLGPVDLDEWFWKFNENYQPPRFLDEGETYNVRPTIPSEKISWCIVGGETGPGARPLHPDWVRSLRDQCQAAGVPLFFKSWGDYNRRAQGLQYVSDPDNTGHLLDGKEWREFPKWSALKISLDK